MALKYFLENITSVCLMASIIKVALHSSITGRPLKKKKGHMFKNHINKYNRSGDELNQFLLKPMIK